MSVGMMIGEGLPKDRGYSKNDPEANMGLPVPNKQKSIGLQHCKDMGLDTKSATRAVEAMSNSLERDDPFMAMEVARKYLDVFGTYRLMAALLTHE